MLLPALYHWSPIVKCLRPDDGDFPYGLTAQSTSGLSCWEAEGMLRWAARGAADQYEGED